MISRFRDKRVGAAESDALLVIYFKPFKLTACSALRYLFVTSWFQDIFFFFVPRYHHDIKPDTFVLPQTIDQIASLHQKVRFELHSTHNNKLTAQGDPYPKSNTANEDSVLLSSSVSRSSRF